MLQWNVIGHYSNVTSSVVVFIRGCPSGINTKATNTVSSDSNNSDAQMVDTVDEEAQDQEQVATSSRFMALSTHTNFLVKYIQAGFGSFNNIIKRHHHCSSTS